jgi:predicted lipase
MYLIPLFLLSAMFLCNEFASAYDEPLVHTALNISQAAYCLDSNSIWDCATCDKQNNLETIIDKKGEQVVIGFNSNYNSIFVGFRGSSNIQNWIDNLKFSQITPYNNTQIIVAKGFYQLYSSLKEDIQVITKQLSSKYATNSILVTGHSLGGALATIMVFDLLYAEPGNLHPTLITFGSPRVGNAEFASIMSNFDIYSNRITHYYDMVPHVPQEFLKYSHISQEIWYNEENNKYTICADEFKEDVQCSDSCAPLHCTSITDHLRYLDVDMGTDGEC